MSVGAKIAATTGLQRGNLFKTNEEIESYFKEILNPSNKNKNINFIATSLTSANEIFKRGGHVAQKFKDQIYSFNFDGKRKILDEIVSKPNFHDSLPLKDVDEAKILKNFNNLARQSNYVGNLASGAVVKKYKNTTELGIRNFIKALFANDLNLKSENFQNYGEIIDFIKLFDPNYRLTANNIATLKRRCNTRVLLRKTVELEKLVDHIKSKFPDFDAKGFYK